MLQDLDASRFHQFGLYILRIFFLKKEKFKSVMEMETLYILKFYSRLLNLNEFFVLPHLFSFLMLATMLGYLGM